MSNLLKVAMIETILSLRQRGWSQRRIARELGINRETVARYLRQPPAPPKPAIAPLGSDGALPSVEQPPCAEGPPAVGRPSDCAPWRAAIQAKLELGLSAQRIHQDLVAEHGFTGSYYCVRRFVHRLEETHELPFRRLECDPGDEAQVDFGTGAPIIGPDGRRR